MINYLLSKGLTFQQLWKSFFLTAMEPYSDVYNDYYYYRKTIEMIDYLIESGNNNEKEFLKSAMVNNSTRVVKYVHLLLKSNTYKQNDLQTKPLNYYLKGRSYDQEILIFVLLIDNDNESIIHQLLSRFIELLNKNRSAEGFIKLKEIIKYFIKQGKSINSINQYKKTPLEYLLFKFRRNKIVFKILKILIDLGADINRVNDHGSILHFLKSNIVGKIDEISAKNINEVYNYTDKDDCNFHLLIFYLIIHSIDFNPFAVDQSKDYLYNNNNMNCGEKRKNNYQEQNCKKLKLNDDNENNNIIIENMENIREYGGANHIKDWKGELIRMAIDFPPLYKSYSNLSN